MFDLPSDITAELVGHGPAGLIILVLLGVIRYVFKRWDADRERLIEQSSRYAELALNAAKALDAANSNSTAMIAAVQTVKLLNELDRTETGRRRQ